MTLTFLDLTHNQPPGKPQILRYLSQRHLILGYSLIIVLSGVDKGLRRQTQIRLKRELVG